MWKTSQWGGRCGWIGKNKRIFSKEFAVDFPCKTKSHH